MQEEARAVAKAEETEAAAKAAQAWFTPYVSYLGLRYCVYMLIRE